MVGCIIEASKGFSVGPSSNASGVLWEMREQQHARRLAAFEKSERKCNCVQKSIVKCHSMAP